MRQTRDSQSPRVVIAGGGVAALEACLALRAFLTEEDLQIDLLSAATRFDYRPLAVLEPFEGVAGWSRWSMDLARFAADQDARLVHDALEAVEPETRSVLTASGRRLEYGHLLIAVGGRPVRALPGAITFTGVRDAEAVRAALDTVEATPGGTVAFAVPAGVFWTLPMYELAILAAALLARRKSTARVALATFEAVPLEAFGPRAGEAVRRVLAEHGIDFLGGTPPVAADAGELELADGRRLKATAVVALPRVEGVRIPGLPHDASDFLPVDEHGRVTGRGPIFAAGDITDFPLKQGGLATQQADAAAEAILADLGMAIVPRPFRPVLQGVLYTDREPAYLRAPDGGEESSPRAYSLWWPPSKIAGRYLSPYLTIRAGAPRTPEVRPAADIVPVAVDIPHAVRATRSALGPEAVPPG
jgi:sulfide:quinone oxidoreductase